MTQKFHAIPTMYRGVQFRSRLEARWAAFFDLAKMEWKYEPHDLRGWIPDFSTEINLREVLIEVKPARKLTELWSHVERIEESGWKGDALILGNEPTRYPRPWPRALGAYEDTVAFLERQFDWREDENDEPFRQDIGWDFSCWQIKDNRDLWAEAGNLVQYKSPRGR